MTTEQWIQFTDVVVTVMVTWVGLASLYVALDKLPGLEMLRAIYHAPPMERPYRITAYAREHVDWVLIGSLFPLGAVWLYYMLVSLDVLQLETNGVARLFLFRIPFATWLLLMGVHLFNGRINAGLRFLLRQWNHLRSQ